MSKEYYRKIDKLKNIKKQRKCLRCFKLFTSNSSSLRFCNKCFHKNKKYGFSATNTTKYKDIAPEYNKEKYL